MASSDPVVIDGRTLEGGGQLLRLALCLSALTSIPVRIHSIRGNRSGGGGLKAQHLACVNWLAHACSARVEGAEKGSKELLFVPGSVAVELSPAFTKRRVGDEKREVYEARLDIKTAGSTGLALQAILPLILFTPFPSPLPVRLTLSGGTNVSGSPRYEYITQVLLPTLESIGFPVIEAKLGKRGWSQGGSSIGNFTLEIPHRPSVGLPGFHFTPPASPPGQEGRVPRPRLDHLRATFIAPSACHAHFFTSLKKSLKYHFPSPTYPSFTEAHENLEVTLEDSRHTKRMHFILVASVAYPTPAAASSSSFGSEDRPPATEQAETKTYKLARDWLYDRKLPQHPTATSHFPATEEIADKVCADLAAEIESGACVDEHMRDQLVVFQALARGRSAVFGGMDREASLHAQTAEWVAAQLLGEKGAEFDGSGGALGVGFGGEREGLEDGLEERIAKLELG